MSQRNSNRDTYSVTTRVVPVAIGTMGVDLRANPGNRPFESLQRLENAQFLDARTVGKRNGHSGELAVGLGGIASSVYGLTGDWVYGGGAEYDVRTSSYHPRAGQGMGLLDENTLWTGDRLYVRPPEGQAQWIGGATTDALPMYVSKVEYSKMRGGENGGYSAYVATPTLMISLYSRYIGEDSDTGLYFTTVVRDTGVTLAEGDVIDLSPPVERIRAFYASGAAIVLGLQAGSLVGWYSYDGVNWSALAALGAPATHYDIWQDDADRWCIVYHDGVIFPKFASFTGIVLDGAPIPGGTLLPWDSAFNPDWITVARDRDGNIGVGYLQNADALWTVRFRRYFSTGAADGASYSVKAANSDYATFWGSLSPSWRNGSDSVPGFYFSYRTADTVGPLSSFDGVQVRFCGRTSSSSRFTVVGANPLSKAFRVGDAVAQWVAYQPSASAGYQNAAHLVIHSSQDFAVFGSKGYKVVATSLKSNIASIGDPAFVSVDPRYAEPGDKSATRFFTGAQALDGYHHLFEIDMLPSLVTARFGRSTYVAGGVVQHYDGRGVSEVGWAHYPEVTAITSVAGGGMVVGSNYRYRIYACYRNAQGELHRSPGLTSAEGTVGVGHGSLTVRFNACPVTSRRNEDVFFEVYRNVQLPLSPGTGSATFYLIDTIAPTSAPNAVQAYEYTDLLGDSGVTSLPGDPQISPIGSASEMSESNPPGCSLLLAHGDRLWCAGGDVPKGQLAFSKLKEPNEVAGFDDLAGGVIVDVEEGEITSLASTGETLLVMQRDRVLGIGGYGPDNTGAGGFAPAILIPGARGASTHLGTALCPLGVVYWSTQGPYLISSGLQVAHIGAPVEPLAGELEPVGVVATAGREVRWYCGTRGLLWDYSPTQEAGRWSTWSFGERVTGAVEAQNGLAALSVLPGGIWTEDPALRHDGGQHYSMILSTGEIRDEQPMGGRGFLARVGVLGRYLGPHVLMCELRNDSSPLPVERFTFDPEGQVGGGPVTDYATLDEWPVFANLESPDGLYRFDRKPQRSPISSIRITLDDQGAGASWQPTEIQVEYGTLPGVAINAVRTYGEG